MSDSATVNDSRRSKFFIIDNEVTDCYNLSAYALLAYIALCRCSKNNNCSFSIDYLAKKVNISRFTFMRALPELEKAGLIKVEKTEGGKNVYTLLEVEKAIRNPYLSATTSSSDQLLIATGPVANSNSHQLPIATTKKTNKQDYSNKTETLFPIGNVSDESKIIPEWIPRDAWDGFVEMRKKIKAPLTQKAIVRTISELEKLRQQGHPPGEVLDQSTMLAWRGVFPLRSGPTVSLPEKRTLTASERARAAAGVQ